MRIFPACQNRAEAALYPLAVFAVNAWVVWRLFFTEYLDQLGSVEGEFIAMARYIQRHWPAYDWFSMWAAGYPVARTYQPAVHYTVAAAASAFGLSTASAYHLVAALSYALGGVAFYYLAKALSGSRRIALGGALLFSLFSPSVLLSSRVRVDAGGLWNARRLQALVVYGELPNLTGLMLGMFGLALLHQALLDHAAPRRTRRSTFAAALVLATVPATNWPSTVALAIAVLCYIAAIPLPELRKSLPRVAWIGLIAYALACPLALPSTMLSTFRNANIMLDLPTSGARRWISAALLLLCLAILRAILARVPFGLRFASLYGAALAWVVVADERWGVRILPLPARFHIAMEIGITLTAALATQQLLRRWPDYRRCCAIGLVLFCGAQMYHYRRHSHSMVRRLDIARTVEYQEAAWFDGNMRGERVLTPGTIQFWMNAFTDTPQMTGCCLQSVLNREDIIAAYVSYAGYHSDAESADYSLLWMKAFAVHAVSIGGPRSREGYKDFRFPYRFRDRLQLAWSSDDDFIYRVPERVRGLARVIRPGDVMKHPPANGIDVAELRPFVAALDDPSLPAAVWKWNNVNSATINAVLEPEQVVSVALNYHGGWTASVNGRPVPVHADGLGFTVIEPHCAGPCTVEMNWSPGAEPWIVIPVALLALSGSLVWYPGSGRIRPGDGH
jgi:hypothetical protein